MERFTSAGPAPTISTWSAASVPLPQRFEYFSDALSSALIPMRADSASRERLEANIVSADFDGVTVIRQTGSPHWSYRDGHELARSGAHTFHLIANYSAEWVMSHCGRIRLEPGDVVLTDSMIGHRLEMFQPYDVVHLKLSETWLQRWLPRPADLVGKRIPANAGWGRALTSYIAQLSPKYMIGAPLPSRVITDQLGALLSIVGAAIGGAAGPTLASCSLRSRVHDYIHQCCADASLSAEAVAAMMCVGVDELHRCLTPFGESFGELLLAQRVEVATRMLQSRLFRGLSILEIAQRAGFTDAAQLDTLLRLRSMGSAAQLRIPASRRRLDD